jgi:hypothetical protein
MHNSAGSFWLWRNGEYLLTGAGKLRRQRSRALPVPRSGTRYRSRNEAVPNTNEPRRQWRTDSLLEPVKLAYLVRGRADASEQGLSMLC